MGTTTQPPMPPPLPLRKEGEPCGCCKYAPRGPLDECEPDLECGMSNYFPLSLLYCVKKLTNCESFYTVERKTDLGGDSKTIEKTGRIKFVVPDETIHGWDVEIL